MRKKKEKENKIVRMRRVYVSTFGQSRAYLQNVYSELRPKRTLRIDANAYVSSYKFHASLRSDMCNGKNL